MSKIKCLAVMIALNLAFALSTRADETDGGGKPTTPTPPVPELPEKPTTPVEPEIPERPVVPVTPEKPEKPDRPEKPENPGRSVEMKEIVGDFRAKLTELHASRADLQKQMKDATEEERAQLREQLQANREEVAQLKEQFRDGIKELHASLKNHGGKIDAEAKAEARAAAKTGRARE
jgi:hypothetical protein